jgi:sugar O-acyltransferase (sialic acid O-acetyltransferase NeuD family)
MSSKKQIIFWGATGQAIVLEEFLSELGYKLIAVFDNNEDCVSPFENVPIYYGIKGFNHFMAEHSNRVIHFMVAIAGGNGKIRHEVHGMLKNEGLIPISAVHQSSYIATNAEYSEGLQVLPNSTIGARCQIGEACIINTSSSIDHECILGNGVHIGPGATLAGCIQVGDYTFIGTNATVLPRIKIGQNVIIGAGSVVTKDIPDNAIAYGNPCKIK